MRIRQVTAVLLGLTAAWVPSVRSQQLAPGGSNYLAYYVSPSYLNGFHGPGGWGDDNPVWVTWARQLFAPGGFMHVVGDYHLHPDVVRSQLREMYAGGQRKISILMHLLRSPAECMDLSHPKPDVCHTTHAYQGNDQAWGLAIPLDTLYGGLLPQHLLNLKNLVHDVKALGYNQLNIRFSVFGQLDPRGWGNGANSNWDQYHTWLYEQYWTALRGVIDSVNRWVPAGDSLQIVYDLNAEAATYILQLDGQPWGAGHFLEHTRRLWRDYVMRYGNTRTIGFTFGNRVINPKAQGWRRGVISAMNHEVYDPVGARPSAYAFDIYPNGPGAFSGLSGCSYPCYDAFFAELSKQVQDDPRKPQILVWEGFYNDKRFATAVRQANAKLQLHIPYVIQWPTRDKAGSGHFTETFPRDYSVYLKLSKR